MKLLKSNDTLKQAKSLLAEGKSIKIAVAFWGEGAVEELGLEKPVKNNIPIQIICNLETGATNPKEIKKLLELSNKHDNLQIKTNLRLHAKLYHAEQSAIISSANASANGLSFEGKELESWHELGVLTQDEQVLEESAKWFDKLWNSPETKEISQKILELSQKRWKHQYSKRPSLNGVPDKSYKNISLLEFAKNNLELLHDRIVVTIYDEGGHTPSAEKKFRDKIKNKKNKDSYDFYENSDKYPNGWAKEGQYIIDLMIKNKKINILLLQCEENILDDKIDITIFDKEITKIKEFNIELSEEDEETLLKMAKIWKEEIQKNMKKEKKDEYIDEVMDFVEFYKLEIFDNLKR